MVELTVLIKLLVYQPIASEAMRYAHNASVLRSGQLFIAEDLSLSLLLSFIDWQQSLSTALAMCQPLCRTFTCSCCLMGCVRPNRCVARSPGRGVLSIHLVYGWLVGCCVVNASGRFRPFTETKGIPECLQQPAYSVRSLYLANS